MENLTGFIVASFALVGSPGPATLSLAAVGASFGVRRGLAYLLGISSGLVIIMAITATGVMGVIFAFPGAAPVITGLGAAYILYLAYRIATVPMNVEGSDPGVHPSFFGGVFLSLVNPKAYASMAALFSGFVLIADRPVEDALIKGLIILTIVLCVDITWLLLGSTLVRRIKNRRTRRVINLVFAVLLVVAVAFAVKL